MKNLNLFNTQHHLLILGKQNGKDLMSP